SDGIIEYHGALFPRSWVDAVEEALQRIEEIRPIIVIRGEPGTGRDTVARAIHAASPRRHEAFVKIRCGVRPPERLAIELFGHERDAVGRRRVGKLEFSHRGTLLLDEVEDLPRSIQPALIDTLTTGSMSRLGGRCRISVDIQVIATTRQVLQQSGSLGAFEDTRPLKVLDIELP